MPRNPPHNATIALVHEALTRSCPPGWSIRVQSAITLADSEPEPDLAVVRGTPRDYLRRHPGPDDVALVVEIADAPLDRDRDAKARIYARARIPQYWIINLVDAQLDGRKAARIPVNDLLPQ